MMEDKHAEYSRIVNDRKEKERTSFLTASKEALSKTCRKKIDTTMIGAINVIELELFELMSDNSSLSLKLREAYGRVRSKILDNGNNQKRILDEEISQYTVEWNKQTLVMPVRNISEGK
jgi:hypothetical protein